MENIRKHDPESTAEKIGGRVRLRRQEIGLSMRELGEKLGVSASTVRRYETCGIDPKKTYLLVALSDVLDVDAEWLVEGDPNLSAEPSSVRKSADTLRYARQLGLQLLPVWV